MKLYNILHETITFFLQEKNEHFTIGKYTKIHYAKNK